MSTLYNTCVLVYICVFVHVHVHLYVCNTFVHRLIVANIYTVTWLCIAVYAIQVGNEKWSGGLGTRLLATCEHLLHSLHTPGGPKPSRHKHCPGTSQNPPTSAEKKQKTKQK